MLQGILHRIEETEFHTLGELFILEDGELLYKCKTLELPWRLNQKKVSCIPKGIYNVVPRQSPKYHEHFHVENVPNRDYILFHSGNFTKDTLGCILVGRAHVDIDGDGNRDVTSSSSTMKELNAIIKESFELTIQ